MTAGRTNHTRFAAPPRDNAGTTGGAHEQQRTVLDKLQGNVTGSDTAVGEQQAKQQEAAAERELLPGEEDLLFTQRLQRWSLRGRG